MRPDLHIAMHRALELGPDHCPPDLFAGPVSAIVSGLKAHSATIFMARHSALCDSFPRTRRAIGAEAFDAAAGRFLERSEVLSRPLDHIGTDFPDMLDGAPAELARVELAWLESYRSPDQPALRLADLAGMTASEVASISCRAHPAARTLALAPGVEIAFDGLVLGGFVLVTRPESDVEVTASGAGAAAMLESLGAAKRLGDLLEIDADCASLLVTSGALAFAEERMS